MSAIPVTAGGTGATTAAAGLSALSGASLATSAAQGFAGPLSAPSVNASINKVLLVTAAPYNAKCDGATDDQVAIQTAFTDAMTYGETVQFPAGTCKFSTITWYGQSFFGAGTGQTNLLGEPGKDLFATPDSAVTLLANAYVHDFTMQVDSSVNRSATAGGGDNTFPNRISGTAGGASNPISAVYGGPPSPAGVTYGLYNGVLDGCYGGMNSGSAAFTLSCSQFTNIYSGFLVGQPITVTGAGVAGGTLTTTVAAVVNSTTLTLTASASTTTSTASGTIGNGIKPPWYFGNCGFAIPASSGTAMSTNFNGWSFRNVFILGVNSPGTGANATCGIFEQSASNGINFDNFNVQGLYGGIIEAPPATNPNTGYFAWTPDTSTYRNVQLSWDVLPVVWYNGTHRDVHSMSIYAGNRPFLTGIWQIASPLGTSNTVYPSATFSQFYNEGWMMQSGEFERFSGVDLIAGGNLDQTVAVAAYINWLASASTTDVQTSTPIHVAGNDNTLKNTGLGLAAYVTNSGAENKIQLEGNDAYSIRENYANLPIQDPVGKIDNGFLATGSTQTPFVSAADLISTCADYRFANGGAASASCVQDPAGTEVTKSYIHAVGTAPFGDGLIAAYVPLWVLGQRVPLTKVYIVTQGKCEGTSSCSATITFTDVTASTTLGTCVVTYGSSWTIQGGPGLSPSCLLNLTSATAGDVVSWNTSTWSGGGLTAVDMSFLAYMPYVNDILSEVQTGMSAVPYWLQYLGDGSEGAYSCTTGACGLYGEHWYSSFSISSGATVTNNTTFAMGPLAIRVTGACTIAGTLGVSAATGASTSSGILPTGNSNWSGSGGGGGGGAAAGVAGGSNTQISAGGSAGAASGGVGGGGSPINAAAEKQILAQSAVISTNNFANVSFYYGGSGGGAGGSSGGAGGRGGGGLILVCGSISFTGAVDVTGQAGTNSAANSTGAGGGGAGGFAILRSPIWTVNTGTMHVSGGAGGTCGSYTGCGAGGAGAAGWYKQILQ